MGVGNDERRDSSRGCSGIIQHVCVCVWRLIGFVFDRLVSYLIMWVNSNLLNCTHTHTVVVSRWPKNKIKEKNQTMSQPPFDFFFGLRRSDARVAISNTFFLKLVYRDKNLKFKILRDERPPWSVKSSRHRHRRQCALPFARLPECGRILMIRF